MYSAHPVFWVAGNEKKVRTIHGQIRYVVYAKLLWKRVRASCVDMNGAFAVSRASSSQRSNFYVFFLSYGVIIMMTY